MLVVDIRIDGITKATVEATDDGTGKPEAVNYEVHLKDGSRIVRKGWVEEFDPSRGDIDLAWLAIDAVRAEPALTAAVPIEVDEDDQAIDPR